jgi:WD40 repeat protein
LRSKEKMMKKICQSLITSLCLLGIAFPVQAFEPQEDILVQKEDGNWYRAWVVRAEPERTMVAFNWSANTMDWVENSQIKANTRAPLEKSKKVISGWQNGDSSLWGISASADGEWLAVASGAGWLQIFEQSTLFPIAQLLGRKQPFRALDFSPDGQTLAACDDGGQVSLYMSGTWDLKSRFQGPQYCKKMSFSISGILAMSGNTAGKDAGSALWLYDPQAKKLSSPLIRTSFQERIISALIFSPDGQFVAVGNANKRKGIEIYQVKGLTLKLFKKWKTTTDISTLVFSPDGRYLASGGTDSQLQLWDWKQAKRFWSSSTGQGPEYAINSLDFSPDGQSIVACGHGAWKGPKTFRTGNGKPILEMGEHLSMNCTGVRYSRDGKSLYTVRQIFSNFNEKILDRYIL